MIDDGVYTLSEVTQYTKVKATTLRHWFMSRSDGKGKGPIFKSDHPRVDDDFAVSFYNLIEAHVAAVFRARKIKPSLIRRAHQVLQEETGVAHPFAHEDLRTDGKRIILASNDALLIDVINKQQLFEHVAPRLSPILYNIRTKMAEAW